MARTLLVCALMTACTAPGWADEPAPSKETVVHLTVQPMAAPRPALKYQLLPDLMEMQPGNPIQGYLKAFSEQHTFFFDPAQVKQRETWETMPLKQLPLQKYPHYGEGNPFKQVDFAARLLTPDWQILLEEKRDGYNTLLPDVQQMRMLASMMKVRFRFQIASGDFDGAVHTGQTMFAMSRHLAQHPSWIGNLVGLAIEGLTFGPLEEAVQQPGCPNLYWALTSLPDPLVGFGEGTRGERLLFDASFGSLTDERVMTQAEAEHVASAIVDSLFRYTNKSSEALAWLNERAHNKSYLDAARKRLIADRLPRARVESFPPLQAVLVNLKHTGQRQRDEQLKWMSLPYPQAHRGLDMAEKASTPASGPFADLWSLTSRKILMAQTRGEQRIAMLRHVEAIRLYAAAHHGALPHQLGDVEVPLPADPFTAKPFRYKVEGDTATLRGTPPAGMETAAPYNVVYVIKMLQTQGK